MAPGIGAFISTLPVLGPGCQLASPVSSRSNLRKRMWMSGVDYVVKAVGDTMAGNSTGRETLPDGVPGQLALLLED